MASPRVRRLARIAAMVLLCTLSLELGSRLYWSITEGVSFTRGSNILHVFYPNVEILQRPENLPDDEHRDILVLGGSVIDEMRDDFERLETRLGPDVRLHVGGRVAHTTLDSRRKTEWLDHLDYDELLIYHGINDCKYNNMPAEMFDEGYSAYPFYKMTTAVLRHRELDWCVLPYTLEFAWIKLWQFRGQDWRRPTVRSRVEWREEGADIKSARTVRKNLVQIIERAQRKEQIVHLATFAYYLPDDYTDQKFLAGELDYHQPRVAAAVWGYADNVRKGIQVHNEIARELAAKYPHVRLVEMESAIPRLGKHYDDPCHFSPSGKYHFFNHLADVLATDPAHPREPEHVARGPQDASQK